jgi:hypothetical protein
MGMTTGEHDHIAAAPFRPLRIDILGAARIAPTAIYRAAGLPLRESS